ncbi:MAG: Gfo/Idh/MocA family oxidoreductase, partial [Bacteroidales bacterium]|nr:Gfo/Idh/MocA family oxidoreductase [Bacteroidales bacterium]
MKGIGIIGCGKIAQIRHIPELAEHPGARIVGYYNPTLSRAEQMAARYGGKVYPEIADMLADPDVEAVVISLANVAHAEVTIQALKAGKDVLCEKPMATTIQECEEMMEAAEKYGKMLLIAQNQRLAGALAAIICLLVPIQMVGQTWDDHDRSGRYTARDFGRNYLSSLEPNAIIFT